MDIRFLAYLATIIGAAMIIVGAILALVRKRSIKTSGIVLVVVGSASMIWGINVAPMDLLLFILVSGIFGAVVLFMTRRGWLPSPWKEE